MPLTHVIRSVQEPWLAIGSAGNHVLITATMFIAATLVWAGLLARRASHA